MHETIFSFSHNLTKAQLYWFIIELKQYLQLILSNHTKDQREQSHLKKRKVFTVKVEKKSWISCLKSKMRDMTWWSW